jgi:hypothetical protein
MIRYIPAPAAEPLSLALWGLARPPEVRGDNDTQYLFPWITALDGSLWLAVETEYSILVHEDAVLDGIADILQPFIDADPPILPADTNDNLAAYIESNRGQVITVYSAFPPFFKDQSLDFAGMVAAGKLNNPDTP